MQERRNGKQGAKRTWQKKANVQVRKTVCNSPRESEMRGKKSRQKKNIR